MSALTRDQIGDMSEEDLKLSFWRLWPHLSMDWIFSYIYEAFAKADRDELIAFLETKSERV